MADTVPFLLIKKEAVAADPALAPGARGARKHVVTSLRDGEEEVKETVWRAPAKGQKCPVLVADNWEMATFNEVTTQDRHYHKKGTEIFIVLEGEMEIDVDDEVFTLNEGDTLVVNPRAVHEILRKKSFLARVIKVNCGGPDDKFVVCPPRAAADNRSAARTADADYRNQRERGPAYKLSDGRKQNRWRDRNSYQGPSR